MNNQTDETVREEQQKNRMFNPNEHLIQIKSGQVSRDYLPVQWRLVWFRSACPHGTIETEMLHLDVDRDTEEEAFVWNAEKRRSEKVIKHAKGFAIFRAVVKDGQGGIAMGTKSEKAASFPDFIEKAETGSIGRALAALGYGTQFAPDLEEAHRIVDSPVERQLQAANGNGHSNGTPVRSGVIADSSANGRNANGVNGHSANSVNGANGRNTNSVNGTSGAAVQPAENDTQASATERQMDSIRKLSEYLGKAMPEDSATLTSLNAKKLINQLSAEYRESKESREVRESKQNNKAS